MYIRFIFTALAAASTIQAFNLVDEAHSATDHTKRALGSVIKRVKNLLRRETTCPVVWSEISTTLTAQYLADGQCTDAARAAIRSAFHDCFNGACDGSLILANECSNSENAGLQQLCDSLASIATEKKVGTADLIQFAAAHAIKTLKGFSAIDLAALIGAHTTAKQRFADPSKAGASLDSTVGTWDNKYYSETKNGKAPFTLESDKNIAQNPVTAGPFESFALSKGAWDVAFVNAMTKMSMIGVDGSGLVDCTSALPGGSRKREIRSSNIFDRLKW